MKGFRKVMQWSYMKHLYTLSLLLFYTLSVYSQEDDYSKIDGFFEIWKSTNTPGCAVGIVSDGNIAFRNCYGMANIESHKPITPESKFAIGSLTKQFTAYCLAILIHGNMVGLNDDIRIYLPEFPYTRDTLRIFHLVFHTSGLEEFSSLLRICGYTYDDVVSKDMIKELIYSFDEPRYKPGDRYDYSNSGYFLLGEIIEKVSGLTLAQFAEQYIFRPLGMFDTYYFTEPVPLSDNIAVSYSQNVFGTYKNHELNTIPSGAGNVISTLNDLIIWEQNFQKDGRSNHQLEKLIFEKGTLNNGDTINYSFGWRSGKYMDWETIFHFGDFNSFISAIYRIPDKKLSIILLSNDQLAKTYFDNYHLADKIAGILLKKGSNPRIPEKSLYHLSSKESVERYLGYYISNHGFTNLSFDDGEIKISHSWGDWYYSIYPESDTVFYDVFDFGYKYKFSTDEDSNITGLWTTHTKLMRKLESDSFINISEECIGNYYCSELNTTYSLSKNKNKLYCKINSLASEELIVFGADYFRYKRNALRLLRNDVNQIYGLIVNEKYEFLKL